MNSNTRDKLIAFIESVESLANAVSSVAGTDAVQEVFNKANELKMQLIKDETIP